MYCNVYIWQCCYRECLKLATEQEQTIRSAVINPMKLQIDEVRQLVKFSVKFCYIQLSVLEVILFYKHVFQY